MKKLIITAFVFLITALPVFAQTANEIINKLELNTVYKTAKVEGSMTVHDRFGEKTTSFISFSQGADNSLIEFTSVDEAGQKILRTKNEIYLFYPDAEQLIRLQGAALRDSVLGSDMSYEDMTGGKGLLEIYETALLGREKIDGIDCFKISLTAKGRNVAYQKQIMWIDSEKYIYRKIEQYALSGRLLKEIKVLEVSIIDGKVIPIKTLITDKMRKNSSTEFLITKIQIGIVIPEDTFSIEELTW